MHGRDVSMNQVAMEWVRLYGVSPIVWDEASELLDDMRGGCVIPLRYERPRKGACEEAVEVVVAKPDGRIVKRVYERRKVNEVTLSPRDVARVIGEVSGYADALEGIDA